MKMLPNEKSIFKSKDEVLEVTNLRVRKVVKSGSRIEISSILVENLSSSRLRSNDPKILLVIAGVTAAIGIVMMIRDSNGLGVLGLAFALAIVYLFIRRQFLEFVGSGGETIDYPTKMGFEPASEILEKVESAQFEAKSRQKFPHSA